MSDDAKQRHVREWAQRYVAAGLSPLPLKFLQKELRDKDGLERTYAPEDFDDTLNVGLQLGRGGVVAIDFDAKEITPAAINAFLPATFGWGRQSKPISQLVYRSVFEKTVIFKDHGAEKGKGTLVEVRAAHQSMAPPSVHPNGEDVVPIGEVTLNDGSLAISVTDVEHKVLRRAAALVATFALMVRYYPPGGARHYWGLHLAGFLRYLEVKREETELLFRLAGAAVHDPEVKDRLDAVRNTYARGDDDPVGGAKLLADNMDPDTGPGFIKSLRSIWGETGRAAKEIERINKDHAFLFHPSGSVAVLWEEPDGNLRYMRPQDFKYKFPEPVVIDTRKDGSPVARPLATLWLDHPQRRTYDGIELAPNGDARPGWYNLWKGFSVEPKRGDWSLYREHLRTMVNFDPEIERWVLAWMAQTVRHPDDPIGTVVAFRGGQGTGKSTFCTWFGDLFGRHFLHVSDTAKLTGHFNAHLERTVLLLADEAVWAGGKAGLGELKRIITETTLAIERKYFDVVQVPNHIHMMVTSNEDWVVPKAMDDRRFMITTTSDRYKQNHRFFASVHQQLREGGHAALLYDLLEDDSITTGVNVATPPITAEGRRQQRLSLSGLEEWWYEELQSGRLWAERRDFLDEFAIESGLRQPGQHVHHSRDYLYGLATGFHEKSRLVITRNQLGVFLANHLPDGYPATFTSNKNKFKERFWVLPALEVCRASWNRSSQLGVE